MNNAHSPDSKSTVLPLSVFTIRVGQKFPGNAPNTVPTSNQELALPPLNYGALLTAARQPRRKRYQETAKLENTMIKSPTAFLPDLPQSPLQSLLYGTRPRRGESSEDVARAARVARATQRLRWRLAQEWDPLSSPAAMQSTLENPNALLESSCIVTAPLSSTPELSSTLQLAPTIPSSHASAVPSTPTPLSEAEMAGEVSAKKSMQVTAPVSSGQDALFDEFTEMSPPPLLQPLLIDARTSMQKVSKSTMCRSLGHTCTQMIQHTPTHTLHLWLSGQ